MQRLSGLMLLQRRHESIASRRAFLLGSCFSRDARRRSKARLRFSSILARCVGVSLDGDGVIAHGFVTTSGVVLGGVLGFGSVRSFAAGEDERWPQAILCGTGVAGDLFTYGFLATVFGGALPSS